MSKEKQMTLCSLGIMAMFLLLGAIDEQGRVLWACLFGIETGRVLQRYAQS